MLNLNDVLFSMFYLFFDYFFTIYVNYLATKIVSPINYYVILISSEQ